MRYFRKHIFFFFVVINVTSTLFCAYEKSTDPFTVFADFVCSFRRLFRDSDNLVKHANDYYHTLSECCPESEPPMLLAEYCKRHTIDESQFTYDNLLDYTYTILEPWAIEKREKCLGLSLKLPLQHEFLDKALKDVLPREIIDTVKSYNLETTPSDHGICAVRTIRIIPDLLYKRRCSARGTSSFVRLIVDVSVMDALPTTTFMDVSPITTFNEFLLKVGQEAKTSVDHFGLYDTTSSVVSAVKSMSHLVYRSLVYPDPILLFQEFSEESGGVSDEVSGARKRARSESLLGYLTSDLGDSKRFKNR